MILFDSQQECTGEIGENCVIFESKNSMNKAKTDIRLLIDDQHSKQEQLFYTHLIEQIPSLPSGEIEYYGQRLNLNLLTCTCRESFYKREQYGEGRDIRVLCKHLYLKIRKYLAAGSLTRVLADHQHKYGSELLLRREIKDKDVFIGFSAEINPPEWISIYLTNPPNYDVFVRFSFNISEWRWAYGIAPASAKQIESYISLLFRKSSRFSGGFSITF